MYDAPLPEDPARIEGMYMSWARAVEGRYSTVAQRAVLAKRLTGLLALISKQLLAKFGEQQLDGLNSLVEQADGHSSPFEPKTW